MPEANQVPQSSSIRPGDYLSLFKGWVLALIDRFPIADGAALLGGLYYLVQSWKFAHLLNSTLDEGSYLFKGYAFATGEYTLFENYGFWSNKMPLSFLIPGYVQSIFGPGLETGRIMTIALAMIMLIGLWILARRLGNRWWGAITVWVYALSPAVIMTYSMAVSQAIIACMLVWTLVLVLGEGRKTWQIALAALLAGLMGMTRINMILVLPVLLGYVFWEHGRRSGIIASIIAGVIVLFIHALYWPGILIMWARVLPGSITPFLDPWRPSIFVTDTWKVETTSASQVLSFFYGVRYHFAGIIGALTTWLLWPPLRRWRTRSKFRVAVTLSALFLIQLGIHMYAALGQDYCTFCFPGYLSFFSLLGLLLVVVSFDSWRTNIPWWQAVLIIPAILLISAGIGYANFETVGKGLLELEVPRVLFSFPRLSSGTVSLDIALLNKFGLEYPERRQAAPAIFGFLGGGMIILIALVTRAISAYSSKRHQEEGEAEKPSFGFYLLIIFLLVGTALLPSSLMAGIPVPDTCSTNIIQSYENAGEHLARQIPPGSLVYWQGPDSFAPLLYVPEIQIFAPQVNGQYSLKENTDRDALLKFGLWSEEIARDWLAEADYVLVEESSYNQWIREQVTPVEFDELESTSPLVDCKSDSRILIFKRESGNG